MHRQNEWSSAQGHLLQMRTRGHGRIYIVHCVVFGAAPTAFHGRGALDGDLLYAFNLETQPKLRLPETFGMPEPGNVSHASL